MDFITQWLETSCIKILTSSCGSLSLFSSCSLGYGPRLEFAVTMLEIPERRPDLFSKLIRSKETVVHLGGFINRHNSHYWAEQSLYKLLKKSQHRPFDCLGSDHS